MAKQRADQALRDFASFSAIADRTAKPAEGFSALRALNALITDWRNPAKLAPLEAEMSAEIGKRVGRQPAPGCLFVPADQQRDVSIASSGGGFLSETQLAPGNVFVSAVRAASVTAALGVPRVAVTGGAAVFAKNLTDATTYWLAAETSTVTESAPTFGQLPVSPKTIGCYVELGQQFLRQLSNNGENFLMTELAKPVAAENDRAFLDGVGAGGVPLGLLRSGISTGSGATLTWDKVCDAIGQVETDNAMVDPTAAGWTIAPDAAKIFRKRAKVASGEQFIFANGAIDGRSAIVSNSVPSGVAVFGDWSGALLATFGVLEIGINAADTGSTLFKLGAAGIRVLWSVDTAILRPKSFYSLTSVS